MYYLVNRLIRPLIRVIFAKSHLCHQYNSSPISKAFYCEAALTMYLSNLPSAKQFSYYQKITKFRYGIGGLSVAVCIKYADNIAKNFATSIAIVISTVASVYIFDFQPTASFLVGAALVISSIFLYSKK